MKTVKKAISKKYIVLGVIILVLVGLLLLALLVDWDAMRPDAPESDISGDLSDAVLHEEKKISLFGWAVNPAAISAIAVSLILIIFAVCVRVVAVPRFKEVPGKFQLVIEKIVEFFDGLAKNNSPHSNGFLGCYIFSAGCYICIGTLFELLGVQWTATNGATVSLPAPLSDINAAIAMGCMSYLVILGGGIIKSGGRGLGKALKEFSLPISMSFRLFGALLSGLLVTELVYYYIALSVVLPVIVGVLFTLLHALIQTYVLVVLTATYFGEVTEPHAVNPDKKKKKRRAAAQAA